MTVADVFIVESLAKEDEREHRFEGQRLADLLRMSGKNPKYFYFQSFNEIPHILQLFKLSNYRFLHVSCHASLTKLCATHDEIDYAGFAALTKDFLKLRRVFFSACEVGNELFSTLIAAQNKGMHSIVAPAQKIYFDHAAAIWGAFYVSIFANAGDGLSGEEIKSRFRTLCQLFPVDFHVSTYRPKPDNWSHETIQKSQLPSPIRPGKSAV